MRRPPKQEICHCSAKETKERELPLVRIKYKPEDKSLEAGGAKGLRSTVKPSGGPHWPRWEGRPHGHASLLLPQGEAKKGSSRSHNSSKDTNILRSRLEEAGSGGCVRERRLARLYFTYARTRRFTFPIPALHRTLRFPAAVSAAPGDRHPCRRQPVCSAALATG